MSKKSKVILSIVSILLIVLTIGAIFLIPKKTVVPSETENLKKLADYSWSEISDICDKNNDITKYFQIGDEKTFKFADKELTAIIIDFNHDDLSDGTGKASITFGIKESVWLFADMFDGVTFLKSNVGGWDKSQTREYTLSRCLATLPEELSSVIKLVDKKTSAGNKSSEIITSKDKLWLFSKVEVDGTSDAVYCDEGKQYEYFKADNEQESIAKRQKNIHWALRSANIEDSTSFHMVMNNGNIVTGYPTDIKWWVSFGFCI